MPARDLRPPAVPVLVRPKDAAAMLAISQRKLWQLTSCGTIPRVLLDKKLVRYKAEDLLRFIEERCEGPARSDRDRAASRLSSERAGGATSRTRRATRRGRANIATDLVANQGVLTTAPAADHGTVPDAGRESLAPEDGPLGA